MKNHDQSQHQNNIKTMFIILKEETIGLNKSGYQVNSFLISRRKHMLWVLFRRASMRHF